MGGLWGQLRCAADAIIVERRVGKFETKSVVLDRAARARPPWREREKSRPLGLKETMSTAPAIEIDVYTDVA